MDCTALEKIVIPSNIKQIRNQTFQGCSNLKEVTILEGVEEIWRFVFDDCTSLERITIPASIRKITDETTFNGCTGLTEITIKRNQSDAESVLGTAWIPESVTKIIYNDVTVTR